LKRQAAQTKPAHGEDARKSRGRRNAKHYTAIAEWERDEMEKSEPETFNRAILPGLSEVPLCAMADAIGLTEGY
jgi:hypothetical protein